MLTAVGYHRVEIGPRLGKTCSSLPIDTVLYPYTCPIINITRLHQVSTQPRYGTEDVLTEKTPENRNWKRQVIEREIERGNNACSVHNQESGHHGSCPAATGCRTASPMTCIWPCQCVLRECASQGLLAANLLAANEALDGDGDGTVDVVGRDVVCQSHAAEALADADDGFQVTNLDITVSRRTCACAILQLTVMG